MNRNLPGHVAVKLDLPALPDGYFFVLRYPSSTFDHLMAKVVLRKKVGWFSYSVDSTNSMDATLTLAGRYELCADHLLRALKKSSGAELEAVALWSKGGETV